MTFPFPHRVLHPVPFVDVLDDGDVIVGRLARLPDGRHGQIHPDRFAALAHDALFEPELADLSRLDAPHLFEIRREIVRMGQLPEIEPQQLFARIAQDVAIFLVDAHQAAGLDVGQGYADRGLIEDGAEAFLAAAQGLVGGGDFGVGPRALARQQAGQCRQQQGQGHARRADPPGHHPLGGGQQRTAGRESQAPGPAHHVHQTGFLELRAGHGIVRRQHRGAQHGRHARRAGGADVLQPQRQAAQESGRAHGVQHVGDPHHGGHGADETVVLAATEHGKAQNEGGAVFLVLDQGERRRCRRTARRPPHQQGGQVGGLGSDVQPPDTLVAFPGPEILDDIVIGALDARMDDGRRGARPVHAGAQPRFIRGQGFGEHLAHERQVHQFGIVLAHVVLRHDTVEQGVVQVRIHHEQVSQTGHDLGIGDDALGDRVAGGTDFFGKPQLGDRVPGIPLLPFCWAWVLFFVRW